MNMNQKLGKLHRYLCKLNPYTQQEALLLAAIVKIAHIGGINRIQVSADTIDNPEKTTPANVYGITFLDSGSGKDKPLRDIDKNITSSIKDDFYKRALDYKKTRADIIEKEAEIKYGTKVNAERSKFIASNSARFLPFEMSDATLEGFIATREAYQDARFGSTFVKISEFGDYITSNNDHRAEFLSMVSEVFDYGDSNPKILKSEKESVPVYDVPSSAIFHTAPSGLLEGKNREKLFTFLNRGIARRSFICYPYPLDKDVTDSKIIREKSNLAKQEARREVEELKEYFKNFYENTKKQKDGALSDIISGLEPVNIFTLTSEANEILELYQIDNQREAREIPDDSDEVGLKSEKANRHWKVLKLSGLLASFEHPLQKTVEKEDVQEAISICSIYSSHVQRFYKARPTDDAEKLYNFFLQRLGQWVTTMDIRSMSFVHKNNFKQWFDNNIDYVAEKFESEGFTLEHQKKGRSGNKYRVSRITKESNGDTTVSFSQASSNDPKETHFESKTIDFKEFHIITGQDKAWSCAQFKDNYRKDENVTGTISIIALDVDDELPLEDAKQIFTERHIKCLISTTRSHQLQKGEKTACDRYRIVLPLSEAITLTKDEHSQKIKAVAEEFGIPVDPSTRNISRLWFGNSRQEYHHIQGGYLNLSVITYQEIAKRVYQEYGNGSTDNAHLNNWFKKNYAMCGGKNNALIRALKHYVNDDGLPSEEVRKILLEINAGFDKPLDIKELERTVFKSLK